MPNFDDYHQALVEAHKEKHGTDLSVGFKWKIDEDDRENWLYGTVGIIINPKTYEGSEPYPHSTNAEEFFIEQAMRDRCCEIMNPGTYEFVGTETELRELMSKEGDFFVEDISKEST